MANYLSADEAARRLGVSRSTLYSYVSRGLLRAYAADNPHQRRYSAEAVEQLATGRRRGRRPKEVAKAALDWGMPVLESAITAIEGGRLFYRGRDAIQLARTATLEETAALLWEMPVEAAFPNNVVCLPSSPVPRVELPDRRGIAHRLLAQFAVWGDDDHSAFWQPDDDRLAEGCGALVRVLASLIARDRPDATPIHRHLARAYRLNDTGTELIRRALVLCADHELNASSFTVRVIASTGAGLGAALSGGLAALSGGRHGGMTDRIEALFDAIGDGDPVLYLRRRLDRGEEVPGFGHPLYPGGDPRASAMGIPHLSSQAEAIQNAMAELTGRKPTLDFALVALRRHLGLPSGLAFSLFALGRATGWIAHALEQRMSGKLIRPRSAYIGPSPGTIVP